MSKYILSYDEADVESGKLQVDSEGVLKSAGAQTKVYDGMKSSRGYLVFKPDTIQPLTPTCPHFTLKGTSSSANNMVIIAETITAEDCLALKNRMVIINGVTYKILSTIAGSSGTAAVTLSNEIVQQNGDIVYPIGEAVPASELEAALSDGSIKLNINGEYFVVNNWSEINDGEIVTGTQYDALVFYVTKDDGTLSTLGSGTVIPQIEVSAVVDALRTGKMLVANVRAGSNKAALYVSTYNIGPTELTLNMTHLLDASITNNYRLILKGDIANNSWTTNSCRYVSNVSIPRTGTSVANAAGDTVTAAEFNALLTSLRNAGVILT